MNDDTTVCELSEVELNAVIGGAYDPNNVIYMPPPRPYPWPGDDVDPIGGGGGGYPTFDAFTY